MKVLKGLTILTFFSILLGSCFDPPEFPDVPEIVFQDIAFCDVSDNSKPDTLNLYIKFKDGDGDLGLDAQDPKYSSTPYHYADFFQNVNGSISEIEVFAGQITGPGGTTFVDVFDIDNPTAGDLIFARTRKDPDFAGVLPPFSCENYAYREFILHSSDTAVLDKYSKFADTLANESGTFYLIKDTLYHVTNPDHYNIEVDFFVLVDPNNPNPALRYEEYDWRKERCSTFDGRFPFLSETRTSLDGSLKYSMESRGFQILFGGKTIKLRIQIKDRLLHKSNVIETGDFTLESIRKCG
jgi:hypothetical protein